MTPGSGWAFSSHLAETLMCIPFPSQSAKGLGEKLAQSPFCAATELMPMPPIISLISCRHAVIRSTSRRRSGTHDRVSPPPAVADPPRPAPAQWKAVREYLPFIATENLLMEAVKRGGNRQELHEVIRRCSHAASARMKEGEPCDLLGQLAALIIYQEPTEPPGGSIALRPVALFLRSDTLLLFPTAQNVTISLPAKRDSHCPHLVKRSASSFARAVRSSSVT